LYELQKLRRERMFDLNPADPAALAQALRMRRIELRVLLRFCPCDFLPIS